MGKRRSIVLVAWLFPPHSSVGAKRPYRLARELARRGWNVTVLTQAHPVAALRERTSPDDLQGVRCVRAYDPPIIARAAAWLDARNRSVDSMLSSSGPVGLMGQLLPTEPAVVYLPHAWQQLKRCINEARPEILWTTSYPFSAHLLGLAAKRQFALQWVADFRDPWTLHWSHEQKSSLTQRIEKSLERSVMEQADAITVTTESLQNAYQNCYRRVAAKIHSVRNSFDDRVTIAPVDRLQKPARLVHFGHVYGGARSLAPVLHALAQLRATHQWSEHDVLLENYGRFSVDDLALAERLGIRSLIKLHNPINYQEGLNMLQHAALLLLPVWQSEHGPLFLPAKLFDYLATSRPILAIGVNAELAAILQQTQAGVLCAENDLAAISLAIENAVTLMGRRAESSLNHEGRDEFSSTAMVNRFEALFQRLSP